MDLEAIPRTFLIPTKVNGVDCQTHEKSDRCEFSHDFRSETHPRALFNHYIAIKTPAIGNYSCLELMVVQVNISESGNFTPTLTLTLRYILLLEPPLPQQASHFTSADPKPTHSCPVPPYGPCRPSSHSTTAYNPKRSCRPSSLRGS